MHNLYWSKFPCFAFCILLIGTFPYTKWTWCNSQQSCTTSPYYYSVEASVLERSYVVVYILYQETQDVILSNRTFLVFRTCFCGKRFCSPCFFVFMECKLHDMQTQATCTKCIATNTYCLNIVVSMPSLVCLARPSLGNAGGAEGRDGQCPGCLHTAYLLRFHRLCGGHVQDVN